ncbi:MAG: response regulator [Candidatus Aminicenantales bacterium]
MTEKPEAKRALILIVEDEPKNMKMLRDLLSHFDYRVVEAADGRSAVETALKERPDLILMDIQLPIMDGMAAAQLLKSLPEVQAIPIVALTAYAMTEDRDRFLKAGFEGYISKPIDIRAFLDTVEAFLTKQPPAAAGKEGEGPRPHRWRLLVADDDPATLKLYAAILPEETYELLTARDGLEALEKAQAERPDTILLDIMMPGIDGLEVTRRLKKDGKLRETPIVLVTAFDEGELKSTGVDSGADEFLCKPFQPIELLARVNAMIRLKQYRDQLSVRRQSSLQYGDPPIVTGAVGKVQERPLLLVAEDNESDKRTIMEALRDQPYRIEAVRTGKEALARIHREKVDLVLLDILLPDISGFDVLRLVKDREDTRDIQVVVITCLEGEDDRVRGIESGADEFLAKPIVPRELVARVRSLLENKSHLDKLRAHLETAADSARTDWLTSLYNHGFFKRFLHLEVKRSCRQHYPIGLILADLDDFKRINDTSGHTAGDAILKEIGRILISVVRDVDLSARYGGDEFAVVLPYSGKKASGLVAKRILDAISSLDLPGDGLRPAGHLSASLGVAVFPDDASSAQQLIDRADEMLYKAKSSGKNRFFIFGSE